MTPYFFKSNNVQLFANYHAANGASRKAKGVLLCYPLWHEYMRAHWTFRQLAEALTQHGFDVLRFDYSGTGDSELNEDQVTVDNWIADIENAAEELKSIANVKEISAVGMRLGGTLSLLAKANFQKIALWDPVVSGEELISSYKAMSNEKLTLRECRGGEKKSTALEGEVLGYQIPRTIEDKVKLLDLSKLELASESEIVAFVSENEKAFTGASIIEKTEPPSLWNEMIHSEQTILAPRTVRQITEFLMR